MPTTITWLGHSAFEIVSGETRILIDPCLTDNPVASTTAEELAPDVIIVTHGHGDHVGDTVAISKRTGALVIANFEISVWLQQQGLDNVHAQHIGGAHEFEFGTVKLTVAHHGSMLPDGSNGGNPCGVILQLPGGTIYHAGDTGLFSDMQLIGKTGLDVAIVPIGDNFTMGPEDSVKAIEFLEPKHALPCHYNTWPLIQQDPDAWAKSVAAETSAKPTVLQPGETFTLQD